MEWSREAFLNLYEGYTTNDQGERDKKLPRYMHPDRRGAFDITFTLPKSVSIAKELGEDSRIGDVMTAARQKAMKEVERQAHVRSPFIRSGNLVWSSFRHPASRSGDPHSHDHVVLFNLSRDPIKRTWKAIELRYIDRKGIGEIYRDETIKGLNKLGYKTKRVGQEFEIVGVPAEVKALFSSRHEGIEEKERQFETNAREFRKNKAIEKGMSVEEAERLPDKPLPSKTKQKLSVYGRPEKPDNLSVPERRQGWLSRMTTGQHRAVASVVSRARLAVKRGKWRMGLKKHIDRLRTIEPTRETVSQVIERSEGRGR